MKYPNRPTDTLELEIPSSTLCPQLKDDKIQGNENCWFAHFIVETISVNDRKNDVQYQ